MDENLYIRSSAAEYLIFSSQAGENGIEVRFEDGTAWLTQKAMAELFGVDWSVIGKHLKNVFAEGELEEKVVCALFAHTTQHGAIEGIIEMTALLLESGFAYLYSSRSSVAATSCAASAFVRSRTSV